MFLSSLKSRAGGICPPTLRFGGFAEIFNGGGNPRPQRPESRTFIGVPGFEPGISRTRSVRDSQLRYTPINHFIIVHC